MWQGDVSVAEYKYGTWPLPPSTCKAARSVHEPSYPSSNMKMTFRLSTRFVLWSSAFIFMTSTATGCWDKFALVYRGESRVYPCILLYIHVKPPSNAGFWQGFLVAPVFPSATVLILSTLNFMSFHYAPNTTSRFIATSRPMIASSKNFYSNSNNTDIATTTGS